jgi:hypothetical protein
VVPQLTGSHGTKSNAKTVKAVDSKTASDTKQDQLPVVGNATKGDQWLNKCETVTSYDVCLARWQGWHGKPAKFRIASNVSMFAGLALQLSISHQSSP